MKMKVLSLLKEKKINKIKYLWRKNVRDIEYALFSQISYLNWKKMSQ